MIKTLLKALVAVILGVAVGFVVALVLPRKRSPHELEVLPENVDEGPGPN